MLLEGCRKNSHPLYPRAQVCQEERRVLKGGEEGHEGRGQGHVQGAEGRSEADVEGQQGLTSESLKLTPLDACLTGRLRDRLRRVSIPWVEAG
jgi:hypothetical protein